MTSANKRSPDRLWLGASLLTMAAIFWASSVPDDGTESLGHEILFLKPEIHNLLHIPAYAVLTFLWWKALRPTGIRAVTIWAAGIAVTYGALDEVHQYFVPGRLASVTDGLLNLAGGAATVILLRFRGNWVPGGRPS